MQEPYSEYPAGNSPPNSSSNYPQNAQSPGYNQNPYTYDAGNSYPVQRGYSDGMIHHVAVLGALMIIQGAAEFFLGLYSAASTMVFVLQLDELQDLPNKTAGMTFVWAQVAYGVICATLGVLAIVSGIRIFFFKSYCFTG
ncbi:MAG: hypothetical protein AAF483_29015 [Planctomycetota bacterium]